MAILQLALVCLRVGTFVFGGGLVMVPLLQADVVNHYHWLNQREFTDAVALGQMTPGPLLVTATFVGYKVGYKEGHEAGGLIGAIVATISMFLPSFVMTLIAANRLAKVKKNPWVANFLWGVRATVVGLIVAAAVSLAEVNCPSLGTAVLGLVALGVLLFVKKLDAGLVVLLSGAVGLALWTGR